VNAAAVCAALLCLLAGTATAADYRECSEDSRDCGQQFSALKFLLSSDREHYGGLPVRWQPYGVLHLLVIAALAFLQWHLHAAQRAPAHVPD
jgi:hypothetical protein